jgi:hypothetical protein
MVVVVVVVVVVVSTLGSPTRQGPGTVTGTLAPLSRARRPLHRPQAWTWRS